ncbi:MAG: Rha family transcriptional regulator [Mongoliitalea sp.]
MLQSIQGPAQAKNERRITSLEMAEITQTLHKNLLQSIRNQEVSWKKVTGLNFQPIEYIDSRGRKKPMYLLNQAESLYIASKFNDEVRARLVVRWMELELENKALKKRLNLREDEQQLLSLIDKWLILGDQVKIANDLGVSPKTVSKVKCGHTRSKRILAALVDRALYNKRTGIQLVIGYDVDMVSQSLHKLQ